MDLAHGCKRAEGCLQLNQRVGINKHRYHEGAIGNWRVEKRGKARSQRARWRRREATKKAISRACSALSRGSQCVW